MAAQIQFCKSADGTRIALATYGNPGAAPLLISTAVGIPMDSPVFARAWEAVASRRYLVTYDRRGYGSSERNIEGKSLQNEIEDISAVLDHLSLDKCALWGNQDSVAVCAAYAALFPERVSHLILFGGFVSGRDAIRPEAAEAMKNLIRTNWRAARILIADLTLPSGPLETKELVIAALKEGMSPKEAAITMDFCWSVDVTDYLSRIESPTLVLHRRGDRHIAASTAKVLAGMIPEARLLLLDGDSAVGYHDFEQYLGTIWEFLGDPAPVGAVSADNLIGLMEDDQENWQAQEYVPAPRNENERHLLRTVLFTDLVGHTEMMSRLGDERGRAVLRDHERITREVLKQHGGTEVKTMGDGFMASFGSVTKAVECAVALQKAFAGREGEPLSVRVGLNAGEPIEEDGDLFGATVILASRIAAKADAGEILVADTVRGLCSGKGFLFADRGEFVAKGFEEPVRVYEVQWSPDSLSAVAPGGSG